MITLTFYQATNFDRSAIPEEWRERVKVTRMLLNQYPYRIEIGIDVEDSSYRYRALMQAPQLVLKFNLPYYVEFPVGTSCMFQNQTFTLNSPQNLKKQGTQKIEYSMTLGTKEDNLSLYKLRNTVDGRLKFSMCAKPHEFIEEIVKNLCTRDGEGVWLYNKEHIIDSTEKTIEFNHTDCLSALNSVATTFETEYEIINNGNGTFEIALHKVEYFKSDPLPLSYGRGNGFVPGVGRTTEADGKPVKRLYVQGGEDNIDRSQYGKMFGYSNNPAELRLPKSQTLDYEGRTYKTDSEGYYIERSDKTSTAVMEDSLDCSEIYPSFIGKVTGVATPNVEKNFYDIIDSTIPDNLNFNNYIIAGESMTIIFQSGMLAGREFEVKYRHEDKRWELVPMEEDGITLPNETFKPSAAASNPDTYAVFGIMLPKEYICNNDNKSGAAWDMFREGAKYLYEHEDQKFTFAGELQSIYAKRNWLKIGGYLKVGSYIHFTDSQFAVDGLDIRIIGIKDYINAPYSPTLEISNSIQSATTVNSQLQQIENTEVAIEDTKKKVIQFTKRRFRDALETIGMLEDAKLGEFSGSVAPIAVQTMAMLIGDESLQFVIGNNIITAGNDDWQITYDQDLKELQCPAGWLKHMTIGVDSIKASHTLTEYLWWQMPEWKSPTLDNPSAKYYLYARVQKESYNESGALVRPTEKGSYVLSETSINIDHEDGYYHLLVGMLNSELYGERSFVTLHGFTEILPGRITTDRIVCSDGKSFLDLAKSALHIGNDSSYMDWNNLIKKALSLKNASINITNQSGQTMVEFNGTDGSGQLAKGNISWDELGNIIANNGTFNNVLLKGALRTPFVNGTTQLGSSGLISISTLGLHNNNCVVIPGYEPPGYTHFAVPFTSEYNGFRATILNYDFDGRTAKGTIANNAPSGYYYYEDGEQMAELRIKPYEGVEMIGIGEGDKFIGWLILNRFQYATKNAGEGFPLRAIFAGKVEFKDGSPTMTKCKRYDDNFADYSGLNISYPISGNKYVTIQLPNGLFSSADNYTVLLTAERLRNDNGAGCYASVIQRDANSFTVYTGDDDTFNEANFTFIVLATHKW
ncbi:MAG: phage tail protein [Lachnospiraceae bacterium]|nr:phage tail protein [Lachnospiraceae bacterium]